MVQISGGIIDEDEQVLKLSQESTTVTLDTIYNFIRQDFETRGYQDALVCQDESFKNNCIEMLKKELLTYIKQATNYYNLEIHNINFHIESRSRAGLIDMVEQLKSRKQHIEGLLKQVDEINKNMENDEGLPMLMTFSYQKGFMKGLTAITEADIINKKL